jgi:hypothetical protein
MLVLSEMFSSTGSFAPFLAIAPGYAQIKKAVPLAGNGFFAFTIR